MAFAWQGTQFTNLDVFRQYLARQTRPSWVRGSTIHHTWKPVPADWRGMASMDSLARFYRVDKGWPAGPHLFLCVGAPGPRNDGIFIGTPLDTRGVHAGACNDDRWGIEIVGDFDKAPWSPRLADLVYSVLLALSAFGDFDPAAVNGHRECNSPKTCPGTAINMNAVRMEVKRRAAMDFSALWGTHYPYFHESGIAAKWRDHAAALGQAVSDETQDKEGRIWRLFSGGAVSYLAGKTEVYLPKGK